MSKRIAEARIFTANRARIESKRKIRPVTESTVFQSILKLTLGVLEYSGIANTFVILFKVNSRVNLNVKLNFGKCEVKFKFSLKLVKFESEIESF